MESPINSSFIPTKISLADRPREEYGSDAFDVIVLLGVIALVVAGTLSAGVFLYKQFLTNDLTAKREQLNKAKEAFQPELVRDLSRLDERISIAEGLLQSHLAPSAFFDVLQQVTLKSIEYKSFDYTFTPPDKLHVKIDGKAASVNGIAYQERVMSDHPAIKNPVFTVGAIGKDGITFTAELDIDPDAVNFVSLVSAAASGGVQAEEGFVPSDEDGAEVDAGAQGFEADGEDEAATSETTKLRGTPKGSTDVGEPTKKRPPSPGAKKQGADEMFGNFE
ncbi:MAG: hypothetical protein RI911_31 [Candidatus Parcubacteria bacterium]|jgi:hypothetical protein